MPRTMFRFETNFVEIIVYVCGGPVGRGRGKMEMVLVLLTVCSSIDSSEVNLKIIHGSLFPI